MQDKRAGFTLIELLVVIGILSLLVVTFAPDVIGAFTSAHQAADARNQQEIYSFLLRYEQKTKAYPMEGGHKFLLAPWVDDVIEKSKPNLDRFFNPALTKTNAHYQELIKQDMATVWPDMQSVSSLDTDYAGRAKEFIRGNILSANEAWIADDNEDGWAFNDYTINIVYGDGKPRTLIAKQLKDEFGWELTKENVFPTYGPESPHKDLKKLDR